MLPGAEEGSAGVGPIVVRDGAGVLQYQRGEAYEINEDVAHLPFTALNTATTLRVNNNPKWAQENRTFDPFGNVTQLIDYGDAGPAGLTGDETTTDFTYVANMPS